MRKKILNYIIGLITRENKYNEIKIQEIKYGLEALYVIVTRTLVFLIISILLNIFYEFLIFYLAYALIRSFSFGLHAKSSLMCFIISSFSFIGIPIISNIVIFNMLSKIILSVYFFIYFLFYSPADTPKKPLVNKINRKKLKIYSMILIIIYIVGIFTLNALISNVLILTLLYQSILISPLSYKILNINYNNYLFYNYK